MDNENQIDSSNENQIDSSNENQIDNINEKQIDYINEDLEYLNMDIDTEEEFDENQQFDENGMPIYENDEEEEIQMRRIVSEKLLNKTYDDSMFNSSSNLQSIVSIKKDNKKKTLSLSDLNNFMDNKIQESQPKKFISKRCSERKDTSVPSKSVKHINSIELNKRCFNPRKAPYFLSEEYIKKMNENNKKTNLNITEFPELK